MLKVRKPVGEPNRIEIAVNRGDMVIKLNGTVVSTVGDCELTEGAIGLYFVREEHIIVDDLLDKGSELV